MTMSPFMKGYGALILCIGHFELKNEPIPLEVWNLFFFMSQKLHHIKYPDFVLPGNSLEEDLSSRFETLKVTATDMHPPLIAEIDHLPTEILSLIFKYLQDSQRDLYSAALTCKRWYVLANPLLYKCPQLGDIHSIRRILTLSKKPSYFGWKYNELVESLHFGPCHSGSLLGPEDISGLDHIFQSHSCLYRLIVQDRDLYQGFHPIFLSLVRHFPNIKQIREIRHISSQSPLTMFIRRPPRPGLNMSDYILTRILKSAKATFDMKEWNGIDLQFIQPICVFLLDLFQDENHSLSRMIPNGIRHSKASVLAKVRNALNILSSALLLQVQYVTICSQRLLDAYCMIYYEALDISNFLNVDKFKALLDLSKGPDFDPLISKQMNGIYECLTLLFYEFSTPEEETNPSKRILDFEKVKTVITSFPPSGINRETCEFIEHSLDESPSEETWSLLDSDEYEEIHYWRNWLNRIVIWHKASKQMEPVKELLRSNMSKIDMLRGVQRRYGIIFMD